MEKDTWPSVSVPQLQGTEAHIHLSLEDDPQVSRKQTSATTLTAVWADLEQRTELSHTQTPNPPKLWDDLSCFKLQSVW